MVSRGICEYLKWNHMHPLVADEYAFCMIFNDSLRFLAIPQVFRILRESDTAFTNTYIYPPPPPFPPTSIGILTYWVLVTRTHNSHDDNFINVIIQESWESFWRWFLQNKRPHFTFKNEPIKSGANINFSVYPKFSKSWKAFQMHGWQND